MKQIQKKFSIVITLSILTVFLMPLNVLADGMVINPDPYSDRWDYGDQTNQQAFINYEDGLEKMILSIGIEKANKGAVWLFPVPANPDKVVIDVVTRFPKLRGEEIMKKAKSNLFFARKDLWLTQIYPFLFEILNPPLGRTGKGGETISSPLGVKMGPEMETDVIIHEHLEKEGITTEIITAKTAQALFDYLKNKDLKVDEGSMPTLDSYIGKEFTFIISWMSGELPLINEQRGVFVTFPTKKIYYPLLLTSVYESKVIPITIRVIGYVSPKIFKDIKDYTEVKYYFDKYIHLYKHTEEDIKSVSNFFGESVKIEGGHGVKKIENVKYTKIQINAPSKMFTDDLWISPRVPLKANYASFFSNHPLLNWVAMLIICSVLSGIFAGLTVFKESRNQKGMKKYSLLGLFNVLSIIGLIIATIFTKTKNVKKEDKGLFEELKRKGYSTWRVQTRDLRKFAFVPVFSIYFLIVCWGLIEILKLGLS